MSINIYTTNDTKKWSEVINRLPKSQQDIFITPEYYQLFEQHNISKAYCFVYEDVMKRWHF